MADDFKKHEIDASEPVAYPVDGILDLHTFKPSEASSLVEEYLHICREKNILQVRIVHGKGRGVLRRTVHAKLEKIPFVASYAVADETAGSWGATIVQLESRRGGMTPRPPQ